MTEIHGSGRWGIRFPSFRVTNFAVVVEGGCWLRIGHNELQPFRTGDFLLQPEAGEFAFMSEPDVPTVFGNSAYKAAAGDIIKLGGAGGTKTRIVGGYFQVEKINTDLFAALLPRSVHVRASENGAQRLGNLLGLIAEEARDVRPGRTLVLQRLAEVMIVEALRRPVPQDMPLSFGLLAGLKDRNLAAALHAIHADLSHDWKLSALAHSAGLSRSAFSRRFTEVIGISPMTYLLQWRMAVAKSALINERLTLDEVAARTGYGSAGAFSHAFLRTVGCTPSTFRQNGRKVENEDSSKISMK